MDAMSMPGVIAPSTHTMYDIVEWLYYKGINNCNNLSLYFYIEEWLTWIKADAFTGKQAYFLFAWFYIYEFYNAEVLDVFNTRFDILKYLNAEVLHVVFVCSGNFKHKISAVSTSVIICCKYTKYPLIFLMSYMLIRSRLLVATDD